MASVKRGQMTASPEWARHLRKLGKRWFWKGERRASKADLNQKQKRN